LIATNLRVFNFSDKAESIADEEYGIIAGAVLLNDIASLGHDSERISCLADRNYVAGW
jgi:hypothetical protein